MNMADMREIVAKATPTMIECGECGGHLTYSRPDLSRTFYCDRWGCGHSVTARDIELDADERLVTHYVGNLQYALAYVTD